MASITTSVQATFTTYCIKATFKASISKRITTNTLELTSQLQNPQPHDGTRQFWEYPLRRYLYNEYYP